MEDTFNRLKTILADNLGGVIEEQIQLDSKLDEDLGADSLDMVEIIIDIEEEFNIELPDDAEETLNTVRDCVELIDKLVRSVGVPPAPL